MEQVSKIDAMNIGRKCGIVLLLAALLILTVSSAGSISHPVQETSLEQKYADQLAAAENLTTIVETYVVNGSQALREAAGIIAEDPTNETLVDQTFADIYTAHTSVKYFLVVNPEKQIIDACPAENPIITPYISVMVKNPETTYSADSPAITMKTVRIGTGDEILVSILPLITKDGTYTGYLIVVFDPAIIYEKLVKSFEETTGYSAWIIEQNGNILYTPERSQREDSILLMTAPNQTELNILTQAILNTKSGVKTYSTYSYGKLKIVNRVAAWDSARVPADVSISSPIVVVTSDIDSTIQVDTPTRTTNLRLEEFALSAYLSIQKTGAKAALAEFNKPDGNFTTQEYYVAAFDINNTQLANPYRPGLLGADRTEYVDINGVSTVKMFTGRAKQGGGYVTMVYENPADNMESQLKVSYVLPINETWYITTGEYYPEIRAIISPDTRMEMIQYGREIIVFIQKEGREAALASLNNGSHYRSDIELSIYDSAGNSLVHDPNPWSTENLLGITDIYGASIGRDVLTIAHEGGGFNYINLPSKSDATTQLSLGYVHPIDDEWFILLTVPMKIIETV